MHTVYVDGGYYTVTIKIGVRVATEEYLTSERSEQVRYSSCHSNITIHIFELMCNVLFII